MDRGKNGINVPGRVGLLLGVVGVFLFAVLGSALFFPAREASGGWVFVKERPTVSVSPAPVPYKKKVKVLISGSGFEPKQEVGIRVFMGGVLSDISFLVKPRPPIANEHGAFGSVWTLNREIRRKLVKPGTAYTVSIVDQDGNTIATAPLVFDKAKKKGKKKKK
ncbi:MAG: hypothetical protein ACE5HC_13195 [Candidatus Binatia bacterium]